MITSHSHRSATRLLRPRFLVVVATTLMASASAPRVVAAQTSGPSFRADSSKVLSVEDYSRWRTIREQDISSDGRWASWVYRFTNVARDDEKPELHIRNLDTGDDVTVAGASNGEFSPDGRWIVYQVDSVPTRDGPARDSSRASHRVELRELATGETRAWRDMRSATFNQASTFLLVRGTGGSGREAGGASDVILHDLRSGRARLVGSVREAAFDRAGTMLAYTVEAEAEDGNGLFVIDLTTGATHTLDNDARGYRRLSWNDAGTSLAVLKGSPVPELRERDNVLLVVPDVRAAFDDPALRPTTLDTTATGFPRGWVISERAPLDWSEDGARIFLGAMPQTPAADTLPVESSDSTTDVDVWRTADRYIQSVQMVRATRDRNFTYRQAFDVERAAYVALSDSTMRQLEISPDGRWAVGRDERAYISDWKPARADFYRVDTATGERTPMFEGLLTGRSTFGISPDGTTFLFWKDDRFQAYDLDSGTTTTLGTDAPTFVDTTYDHPGPVPSWGLAGYTADGKSVIVEDRYDLWSLPLDGGEATNITDGFGLDNRIVLRPVRFEPIDPAASRRVRTGDEYDLSEAVTLSAFGERTKKAGFYRLSDGDLTELVYDDAMYDTPRKAAHADRLLYTRQTFTESPDLRASDPDFAGIEQITDANPQQAEYRWGHDVLFDFADRYGHPLQGLIWLPDDYQPGERRPVLVTFYEKNSQILNRYPMPELLVSVGRPAIEAVSRGYIVMIPDVDYHTGSSHNDQLDAVESATRTLIDLGYADPDRIGLHGHSYGGEGAAYIGTRSTLFAAVAEGAGVTDLYTDFSQAWGWSYQNSGGSGQNGNQYYIYGQGRWGASPWEIPEVYRDESALSHADDARQPFLLMHGTADPTVSFNESFKFYNALRFNEKTAYLLAYPGEGHHLSKLGNRIDFTNRFFDFFDHYLRDAPAPQWMTDGIPFIEKAAVLGPDRGGASK